MQLKQFSVYSSVNASWWFNSLMLEATKLLYLRIEKKIAIMIKIYIKEIPV